MIPECIDDECDNPVREVADGMEWSRLESLTGYPLYCHDCFIAIPFYRRVQK